MKHLFILAAVVFAVFSEAQGLNCYVCSDCVHIDKNTLIQPCSASDGLNFITTTKPIPPTYAPIPPLTPPIPPNVGLQLSNNRKLGSPNIRSPETDLATASVFQCFTTTAKNSSGTYVTNRGCVVTEPTSDACAEIKQHDNNPSEICDVCSVDKCNSGTTLNTFLSLNMYGLVAFIISKLV